MQGRRIASNRVYASPDKAFTNYVVEINADGQYVKTYPLDGEQAATEWLGGIMVITPLLFDDFEKIMCVADFYATDRIEHDSYATDRIGLDSYATNKMERDFYATDKLGLDTYATNRNLHATDMMNTNVKPAPLQVYHISGVSSTSAEFRTNDSGSNCHIERLTR